MGFYIVVYCDYSRCKDSVDIGPGGTEEKDVLKQAIETYNYIEKEGKHYCEYHSKDLI